MVNGDEIMKPKNSRFSLFLVIVIIMLFLSACSPPAYHLIVVEKIGVNDNIIYVRASQDCNSCDEDVSGFVYYASRDNGQTWEENPSPTNEILQILEGDQNKQSPLCLSVDSQICYQITDQEQVEISTDGGIVWQSDWQIPVGRAYYMQRYANYYPAPDTTPFDMEIIESSNGHFVIVATGNQGVLVKSSDGKWSRYAVGQAIPTPYQAASFSEATDVLFNEWIVAILIAISFFLFLSVCIWVSVYLNSDPVLGRRVLIACLPFVLSISVFVLYYLLAVSNLFSLRLSGGLQTFVVVLPIIGFVITWLAVIRVSRNRGFGFLALVLGVIFSILLYLCIFFPFQLWALGTIQVYETAQVVVWIVGIIALFIGVITEIKIATLAVKQTSD